MQNAGLFESQAGVKTARRNINNLRYADDTTLMAESALQGNTEVPGVSREVPCSVLKCETVLDTLDATAKVPRHAGFPRGEHRGSRHHFI